MSVPDPVKLRAMAAKLDSISRLRFRSQEGKSPWGSATDSAERFDYIIVGGGAAGSVVANRLAEDPAVKVLILEAGLTDDFLSSRAPGLLMMMIGSENDWRLQTVPQTGMNDRRMHQPRGKMLGGSSAMNAMMYHRGAASDYDEWEQPLGNEGWSYKACLPYFKKSEGFKDPDLPPTHPQGPMTKRNRKPKYETFEPEYHGTEGPWQVSFHSLLVISEKFIEAALEEGFAFNKDFNGTSTMGTNKMQTFIQRDGVRSSLSRAFLNKDAVPGGGPAAKRGTIRVALKATVRRVLVHEKRGQKIAFGVEFLDDKKVIRTVLATKEVVLCAGAFGSPQILLASGIGPAPLPHVPHVHTLAGVGQGLQDHLAVNVIFSTTILTIQDTFKTIPSVVGMYQYATQGLGPFLSQGGEGVVFVRLEDIAPDFVAREKAKGTYHEMASGPLAPHLEIICLPVYFRQHGYILSPDTKDYYTMAAVLLNPVSKGTVKIETQLDPRDGSTTVKPLIDPAYLTDKDDFDIRVLAEAVRFIRKLSQRMVKKDPAVGGEEVFPGETVAPGNDENALHRFIRSHAETNYHPTSTCRMGPATDPLAVVDPRLCVYGVDNLRVVDASVMPKVPAGHTCAPTVMIAERAADMIKADWRDPASGFPASL